MNIMQKIFQSQCPLADHDNLNRIYVIQTDFSEIGCSLSLYSLANWIKHKRRLEQQNYSLLRNIRKGIPAPTPKHFQSLLKFE